MKTTLAAVIVGIVAMSAGTGLCQSYWVRTYDSLVNPMVVPLYGGNVLAAGATASAGQQTRIRLMKIDASGDTIWNRTYGEGGNCRPWALSQLADSSVLIAGTRQTSLLLLKISRQGDTIWKKIYGGSWLVGMVTNMVTCSDSTILVSTGITSDTVQMSWPWLLKINARTGDTLWTKNMMIGDMYPRGILALSANSILMYGAYYSSLSQPYVFVSKIDALTGQTAWHTIYGMAWGPKAAITLQDNSIFILASKQNPPVPWLLNVNLLTGDTVWSHTYDGYATAMSSGGGGSVLIGGRRVSSSNGTDVMRLLKVNANQETVWDRAFDGIPNAVVTSLAPEPDGTILVTGKAGITADDIRLLKVNASGDTLWTRSFGSAVRGVPVGTFGLDDGRVVVAGVTSFSGTADTGLVLISLADDRYARRDSSFRFKIPVGGDSLSRTYAPVKIPPGMSVTPGGTVTWVPQTDSAYKENVTIRVVGENGRSDTLNFNIWVNRTPHTAIRRPLPTRNQGDKIIITSTGRSRTFMLTLPARASSVAIFDCHARLIRNLSPNGATRVVWNGKNQIGQAVTAGVFVVKVRNDRDTYIQTVRVN